MCRVTAPAQLIHGYLGGNVLYHDGVLPRLRVIDPTAGYQVCGRLRRWSQAEVALATVTGNTVPRSRTFRCSGPARTSLGLAR